MIHAARLRDIETLNKIFMQSLESSFSYFSPDYIAQLRGEHSRRQFFKALLSAHTCFLIARLRQQVVGYSLSRIDALDSETGFIHWMYVHPSAQGKGVGQSLLQMSRIGLSDRGARRIRLLTHDKQDFYLRQGFSLKQTAVEHAGGVAMDLMESVLV